ncbi:purine-nucleoside phosphorylase [Patulibacter americanus]|uniref:phosphorylase family protein n=1 Tax=Patulibacter americanus TaxID=588672 RepID=UPI0003B797CC|nr:purine-nucleoside phosphorylase [Patulibacter americanus]
MTEDLRLPPILRIGHAVADRAVLVGDPGRALVLAQSVLTDPLMSNHARGLWGYTGTGPDGAPLTVQATGVGGPSAAAVLRELAAEGVTRVVRAGSAAVATPHAPTGQGGGLRAVTFAVARDGTSRALGVADGSALTPDPVLLERLLAAGIVGTGVVSVDLLPADGGPPPPGHPQATLVDRQTAAVLAAARRLGVPAAAVLGIPGPDEDKDAREAGWRAVGAAAAAALGA